MIAFAPVAAGAGLAAFPYRPGRLALYAVAAIVVAVVLLVAFIRSRRAESRLGPPPGYSVRVSPDGRMWWDGQAWQDIGTTAPPAAPRSADAAMWWDGRRWHPVPRP